MEEIQDMEEMFRKRRSWSGNMPKPGAADLSQLLFDSILRHAGEKVASCTEPPRQGRGLASAEVSMENVELRLERGLRVV